MLPISIHNLSKSYKGKWGGRVVALDDLGIEVVQGEIFGYLGPNGAGKSTTIKALVGQVRPDTGKVELFGIPSVAAASRRRIGYLPENPSFYDNLNAREYLALVGRAFGMSQKVIEDETDQVLALLELTAAAKRPIRGFSKGMVQRLGLAQVLLHDPDLYILDEPMSGLDPLGRALVKKIMLELKNRGKTVFFSTHVTADVEAVCDRVGVIVSGRLRALSSVEEILQGGIEAYHIHLRGAEHIAAEGCDLVADKPFGKVFYVPRLRLPAFMAAVECCGGEIMILEPVRKDLEAFFLDIVARSGS